MLDDMERHPPGKDKMELSEDRPGLNYTVLLPDEVILEIYRFLGPREMRNASLTCHRFRSLVEDNLLWKDICYSNFTLTREASQSLEMKHVMQWKEGLVESIEEPVQGDPRLESMQEEGKETPIPTLASGSVRWKKVYRVLHAMKWDENGVGQGIQVSGHTAKHNGISYATIKCKPVLSQDVHVFSILVNSNDGGGVGIGVCPTNSSWPFSSWIGDGGDVSTCGHSYFSNGCIYNKGAFYSQKKEQFAAGDIITVCVDMQKHEVEYFKNYKSVGVVFSDIGTSPVVVAVSLSKSSVTLLPCDFLNKTKP
jgi:hypothetical protein